MDKINKKIIDIIKEKGYSNASSIAKEIKISRQAVHKRLKKMIQTGILLKTGNTKAAKFFINNNKIKKITKIKKIIYNVKQVDEDKVFEDLFALFPNKKLLNKNSKDAFMYVFTEVLNNAIEHSKSEKILINVEINESSQKIKASIRDYGRGLFFSIKKKFNLPDENESLYYLLPGKTTTLPERHSGEGIFFSSKISEEFRISSHKIELTFEKYGKDFSLSSIRNRKGTQVIFLIPFHMKKKSENVFIEYAPPEYDYKFIRTLVFIKVSGEAVISRSQAKRLVKPLENKFLEIVLDFSSVKRIGQAFADELFRVFLNKNKNIIIKVKNIKPMLKPVFYHTIVDKARVIIVDNTVDKN